MVEDEIPPVAARPADAESALSRVRRLRGVSYDWRDEHQDKARRPGSGRELGVLAQDVEAVFPEAVSTTAEGWKQVDYVALIGPLIEAVKELAERVEALERSVRDR